MSSGTNSERITQNTSKINSSIEKIKNLKVATFQDKEITENGTYTADEDYSGLGKVTVNVASSGTDTSDATATADLIIDGFTAYANGEKLTGTIRDLNNGDINLSTVNIYPGGANTEIQCPLEDTEYTNCRITNGSNVWVRFTNEKLAEAIDLTADKIVKGDTVLGIEGTAETGTDTSDATATAEDIVEGKTAYVNGEKLEGLIKDCRMQMLTTYTTGVEYDETFNTFFIHFSTKNPSDDSDTGLVVMGSSTFTSIPLAASVIANQIGLTADVIKKGVTVLGIEGTYEGGEDDTNVFTEEEAEVANTNLNDVLGIEDDEISNLPKEDEEEANNILNDILDINEDE
jgi:hypothetical protein